MGKLRGTGPTGKLSVFIQTLRANELDDGLLRSRAGPLREKYGAVIRASQPLPQRELFIYDAAFPVFPEFGRCAHRPIVAKRYSIPAWPVKPLKLRGKCAWGKARSSQCCAFSAY
jgi:hypothetical protein